MQERFNFYDTALSVAYVWSGKADRAGGASFIRASLYVSAAQLFNVATCWFLYEAGSGVRLDITATTANAFTFSLFGLNALYSFFRQRRIGEAMQWAAKNRMVDRISIGYLCVTAFSFVGSSILLYRSSSV